MRTENDYFRNEIARSTRAQITINRQLEIAHMKCDILFQEMLKGNNNVVVIKLVRLFRIPVVLSYFSQFDVRTVSESLFSRESIGKQYAYKQTLYNISLVL